jgi:hypothetical protein
MAHFARMELATAAKGFVVPLDALRRKQENTKMKTTEA